MANCVPFAALRPDPAGLMEAPEPGIRQCSQAAPTWALYGGEPILQASTHLAQLLQFGPTQPAEVNGEVKMCFLLLEEQKQKMCQASTQGTIECQLPA